MAGRFHIYWGRKFLYYTISHLLDSVDCPVRQWCDYPYKLLWMFGFFDTLDSKLEILCGSVEASCYLVLIKLFLTSV